MTEKTFLKNEFIIHSFLSFDARILVSTCIHYWIVAIFKDLI